MEVDGARVCKSRAEPEFAVALLSTDVSAFERAVTWEVARLPGEPHAPAPAICVAFCRGAPPL